MTLHIVSETDPVHLAWQAFDKAALELNAMYSHKVYATPGDRLDKAVEVSRLWSAFSALINPPEDPTRPAA